MQDILGESLRKLKFLKIKKRRMVAILLILSLVVSLDVFWTLRKPGLTLAGVADCKITEHTHDDDCGGDGNCTMTEHVHRLDCYSDETVDTETQLDWQNLFAGYPYTGDLRKDLVGIAKTQVGYSESKDNFEVGDDGIRCGYSRYGAWYGAPYNDWSAMFVSFCLHYAKADPSEYPGNTGADSMASLWKISGHYADSGGYKPLAGDLVFFDNNTVGIVAEVQNATFYAIRGDVEGSVRSGGFSLTDKSIVGWGITGSPINDEARPPGEVQKDNELLDISHGPAVYIIEGGETIPVMARFSLRRTVSVTDLVPYLEANGGSYFFTLLDNENHELPKDADGNYVVQAEVGYKLTLSFVSPEGFLPGTYQYQIPNGLLVDGGDGTFVLKDGTVVGDWTVSDDGIITLYFNEHINSRTDITISATLGIHFPVQEDPIDFDGKITVKIEKPEHEKIPTEVQKWGVQGNEANANAPDSSKIYWSVYIVGKQDSQIPGSVITDNVLEGAWSEDHRFTESDIAGGLTFGVAAPDPVTGQQTAWHSWHVSADDPNLTWTETSWSYLMPETARCQWCGDLVLGNEGWSYTITYSSTPYTTDYAGAFGYENEVTVDGAYAYAWFDFTHGEAHGEIVKDGTFVSDAGSGKFLWEFQALIPGMREGHKADYFWYIMDYMAVTHDDGSLVGYIDNDSNKSTVTANHSGETIRVPRIQDAGPDDPYAWHAYWSADHNDGIYYGQQLNIVCKCNCTAETCPLWNGHSCGSEYWYEADDGYWYTNGYCQCWTETRNTTFTFTYETDGLPVIEQYGGRGNKLRNEANLYNKPKATSDSALVDSSLDYVPIPGVFKKELSHDFNGYTANYKITINESKLVLTNGTPLSIHDVMSDTLAYISGSLVITAEDVNGNITTLNQDVDYTVTYDGTGNATDENGNEVHVLDIVIHRPQPVMYLLDYDTTLIIPAGTSQAIKYNNSATISLWGQDITENSTEKVYADINIAAKNYKVEVIKKCATTGEPLVGATFGLYNAHGGLITTAVTNINGELFFQTNIIEGIILREHELYYVQELKAPAGYRLDDQKYWFCFCNERSDSCEEYEDILSEVNALRIPFEQVGEIQVVNELLSYDLPATGGSGTDILVLVSVTFIVIPLVYIFIRWRKRERRGVG